MAILSLLCAGCGEPGAAPSQAPVKARAAAPAAAPVSRGLRLYLASDGLELADGAAGASRPVPFGTSEAEARARIEPVTGRPRARTDDPHCRVQPRFRLDYPGGLALGFEAGRFVAWEQSAGAGYRMRSGVAIDSPRAALRALGPIALRRVNVTDVPIEEFTAGAVSGVLLGGRVRDFTATVGACR
ncbi:MAG TPA: hypothetical protein VMS43_06620 [Allosphingosinicella sp.]|nr:hypothetical protein [Allosphingosinicella sp.]